MQKYLVNTSGMDPKTASGLTTGALLVFILLQPAISALCDKIGRRTSMMIFGAGAAICTVPILTLLQNVQSPGVAFLLIVLALADHQFLHRD